MTDRILALTVVLDRPIRDDDAQPILDAIRMIRGVANVTTASIQDSGYYAAKVQVRMEMNRKLLDIVQDET